MAIRTYRQLPPYKLKGVNIGARPYDYQSQLLSWEPMWRDWPWSTWIKPNIDNAKADGANYVRIIGSACVVGIGYLPSHAAYFSQWDQLIGYCQSVGLGVHVTASAGNHLNTLTASSWAAVPSEVALLAAHVAPYPNVIAFEPIQEASLGTAGTVISTVDGSFSVPWSSAQQYTVMAATLAACRAAAPDLAMSFSYMQNNDSSAMWGNSDWANYVIDYIDAHVYYTMGSTDADAFMAAHPGKPLLLAEYGGPAAGADDANKTARLNAVNTATLAKSQCAGGAYWAGATGNLSGLVSDDFGMYAATDGTAAATPGAARTSVRSAYRGLPAVPIPSSMRRKKRAS